MLSKKLYFIFVTGAVIVALVTVFLPDKYNWVSLFMMPFVVLLVLSYMFSPQLNWWWFQKYPPELPLESGLMLLKYFPFYRELSAENKKRFRHRVAMYIEDRAFQAQRGEEEGDVSLELKTIVAANAVMLTFGRKDFILNKFERIFIYLQAFPSPNHKFLHASELNEEDSCLVFSAEHIVLSFRESQKYYNITLHEFARAFQLTYSDFSYPIFEDSVWSGLGKEKISSFLGFPEKDIDLLGVSVNFFFNSPEKFKALMPKGFEEFQTIFNLNPLKKGDPVVDKTVVEGVP